MRWGQLGALLVFEVILTLDHSYHLPRARSFRLGILILNDSNDDGYATGL